MIFKIITVITIIIVFFSTGLILKSQLSNLVSEGLSSVNISLDTLCAEKFSLITRRDKKGDISHFKLISIDLHFSFILILNKIWMIFIIKIEFYLGANKIMFFYDFF